MNRMQRDLPVTASSGWFLSFLGGVDDPGLPDRKVDAVLGEQTMDNGPTTSISRASSMWTSSDSSGADGAGGAIAGGNGYSAIS